MLPPVVHSVLNEALHNVVEHVSRSQLGLLEDGGQ